jgi:hypothetical protein
MKLYIIAFVLISSLLQSCNNNIDDVIDRLDSEDFTELKGLSIYFRSRGNEKGKNIYFINTFTGKCSPYIVEVDKSKTEKLIINNELVLKMCNEDYLDKKTITTAIERFLELNVSLIQVDSFNNVYINPFEQAEPILLKKSDTFTSNNIDKFSLYKGSWFIRK